MKKFYYFTIIILLLISIISAIGTVATSQDNTDTLLDKALKLAQMDRFDEALEIVRDVLNRDPDNPKAHYCAGLIYLRKKDYDTAIKEFETSITLHKRGNAYYQLGLCYEDKGNLYEAKEYFDEAKNLYLAESYTKEYEDIETHKGYYKDVLEKLIKITSGYEKDEYEKELANFINSGRQFPTATPTLTPTHTPTPTVTPTPTLTPTPTSTPRPEEVHFNKAKNYLEEESYDNAKREYELCLQINSNIPEAWYNLGIIYDIKGDKEKAVENFRKYLELKPDAEDKNKVKCMILLDQGEVFYNQGRYWKAIETFKELIDINPNSTTAYFYTGMAYDKVEKYQAATEAYEMAVEADPDNAAAHYNLAIHYEYLKRKSDAACQYKEYLRLCPNAEDADKIEQKIRDLQ